MPAWDVDEGGLAMRIDGRSVVCHGHVVAAGLDRPVHAVTAALVFNDVGSAGHGDERHPQEVWVVGGDAERERPGLLEAVGVRCSIGMLPVAPRWRITTLSG